MRELVPIPPFESKARVPVPAPMQPSATGPADAIWIAAITSALVTRRARISFKKPSLVSPTTAFTERTRSLPGSWSVHSTRPAMPSATERVLVRTIGVSISPSSSTCVAPANLPKPLPTANPAGTLFCGAFRGAQCFKKFWRVAQDRLEVADAEARQCSLDPVDDASALADETFPLAAGSLRVLLRQHQGRSEVRAARRREIKWHLLCRKRLEPAAWRRTARPTVLRR